MEQMFKIQTFLAGEWGDYSDTPVTREFADRFIFSQVERLLAQPGEKETLADLNRWRAMPISD